MLINIEVKMEEYFVMIDMLLLDIVVDLEKWKEKECRCLVREERVR